MANITKVPNGPLIKKKGPFKGSTLKAGGVVKKAQNGTSQYSDPKPLYDKLKKTKDSIDNAKIKLEEKKFKSKMNYLDGKLKNEQSIMNIKKVKKAQTGTSLTPQQKRAKLDSISAVRRADIVRKKDSILNRNAAAQGLTREQVRAKQEADKKKPDATSSSLSGQNAGPDGCKAIGKAARARKKNGGMIKRADGSYSKRGLWDNIRANKGSGKKPTKQMLQQEKKIKAKTKK
jgi:hypothetical protein